MSTRLCLLMVEDSTDDAELLLYTLRRGGFDVVWQRVDTADAMQAALLNGDWDVITSDHAMPCFSAPQALALARQLRPEIPLVIVSGEIDLNLAVSLMKSGAQDYIQKHELARVVPAIERELNDAATRRQQRQTEEALQRQQALMSRIYETSPVGIVMVDRTGQITFANPEAERVLGLKKDQITQRTYNAPGWRITAFDGGPFPDEELPFALVMKTGQPVRDVRHAIEWPDGRRVLLSINAAPLVGDAGQLTGMVATLHDVTGQVYMAEALRESEARFRTLVDSMDDIIFTLDTAGRHTGLYGGWVERLGLTQEYFLGRTACEIMGEEAGAVHQQACRLAAQGETVVYDWSSPLPEGGQLDYQTSLSPIFDPENAVVGLVGVGRDISAYKQVERTLRVREAQLRASLENTPNVAVQWYDQDGRIVYWNATSETLYGWPAAQALGKTLDQLIYRPEENAAFMANLQRVMATGEPIGPYESAFRRRDGSEGVILSTQFLIPSEGTQPVFVCVDVDVTPLKQSQRNLEILFDTIDDLLFVLDAEGRILHVNDAVVRVLGFSADALVGQPVLAVHPEERRAEAARIVAAMLAGETETCPVPVVAKDGRYIPVETRVVAGEWNGCPALFGVTRDISALKLSEEKFARAFQSGAVIMAISTIAEGRYLEVNDAFLETLGFSRQEVIGRTSQELGLFVDPGERETVRRKMETMQRVENVEARIRCKDGRILTGIFSVSSIYVGTEPCWITTMLDITERKRIENTLAETKTLLDAAIEQTPIPMVLVSVPEGILRYANRACLEFLGIQDEPSLVGRPLFPSLRQSWQDFDTEGNPVPIAEMPLGRAMRGEATTRQEYRVVRKDGTQRWDLATGVPIYDASGSQIAAYIVFSDITDLKAAELALQESEQKFRRLTLELEKRVNKRTNELEAANKELEAFTHSVSHDLRAPLRGIYGYSNILIEDYADALDEQGRHYLQRLKASAGYMSELVNNLLELSRISRTQMNLSSVNLSALAETVVAELREGQADRVVAFSAEPDLMGWADPNLMRIVLDNLLRNAWKFTGNRPVAQVAFGSVKGEDGETVYYLRDNGAGFDMQYADKLFIAFQRLHTSEEFDGTGIGLTTVQRIIHRHGGRIWAESVPDQGATFFFTLMAQPYEKP
ncbi:MAG: PAS domain S-box protein [Chloroflexota bacterium]